MSKVTRVEKTEAEWKAVPNPTVQIDSAVAAYLTANNACTVCIIQYLLYGSKLIILTGC